MLLELERVERAYASTSGEVPALRGVDLVVHEGEYVLLEGRSGAGKTTLLNIAGLLDAPTRGRVAFRGIDLAGRGERERATMRLAGIGFVFQHYYLVPDMTLLENVALPALARGERHARAFGRAATLLSRVGLDAARDRLPRELSGGEQQRAGVARALVNEPRLLLCDEPTGNLDAASADVVATMLAEANEDGAAVLVATHDPSRFPQAQRRLKLVDGFIRS